MGVGFTRQSASHIPLKNSFLSLPFIVGEESFLSTGAALGSCLRQRSEKNDSDTQSVDTVIFGFP